MTGGPDAQETAKFIEMCDSFFDCLNVDNLREGVREKKDFKKPYEKKDDPRLEVSIAFLKWLFIFFGQWLRDEFMGYMNDWKESVEKRVGYTPQQKQQNLLSELTREGISITGT